MANQIYGYNPSPYGGVGGGGGGGGGGGSVGLSSVYPSSRDASSYLSDPAYTRYLSSSDPLSINDSSKYLSSSLYQSDPYMYPPTDIGVGVGGYSAVSRLPPPMGAGAMVRSVSQPSWPSIDVGGPPGTGAVTGYDPNVAGLKRPSDALYHQNVLGSHNTIGQSEAYFSTNALSKRPRFESATSLPVYPQRPGEKDCAHYMLTRTCKFGDSCKFDHPIWVPEGGIPDWKEVPLVAAVSETLPERPGEPDCPYFLKTQKCKFGFRCKFNHPKDKIDSANASGVVDVSALPSRPSEPPCSFYMKTGKCKFGIACKFDHPKDIEIPPTNQDNANGGETEAAVKDDITMSGDVQQVKPFVPFTPALLHNSKGLPVRPGEVDCPFYLKTGSCKYGATCRYNHPDRHSINPPVAAGLGPAIPSPASNMNMGVMNPSAPILSSVDPRIASQMTVGLSATMYPQRPGQIECDFYMKTGECKFGERCKFHHPVDRSAPTQSVAKLALQQNVKLTLAGLPRREGSISCPFYMKTGTCKYGVTCKFDHPPPGEAIAMAAVQGTSVSAGGDGEDKVTETNQEQQQQQQ